MKFSSRETFIAIHLTVTTIKTKCYQTYISTIVDNTITWSSSPWKLYHQTPYCNHYKYQDAVCCTFIPIYIYIYIYISSFLRSSSTLEALPQSPYCNQYESQVVLYLYFNNILHNFHLEFLYLGSFIARKNLSTDAVALDTRTTSNLEQNKI